MTGETDLIKLYSARILALAADIPHADRLEAPDATVKKRAPLCGSAVTVDICADGEQLTALGQDVRACALGQAAASVLGAVAVGLDLATLQRGRDQLRVMLEKDGPVPDAPFGGFEVLQPARSYRNRHASILLAIDATVEALEGLQKANLG